MLNTPEQNKMANAVAILLGFNGVVLFDSQIVGETNDDAVAVVGLRPELFTADSSTITMAIKGMATYGCSKIYLPDPANPTAPFSMRSWPDDDLKRNVYDTDGQAGIFELHGDDKATTPNVNKGAVSIFKMLANLDDYTGPKIKVTGSVETTTPPAGP